MTTTATPRSLDAAGGAPYGGGRLLWAAVLVSLLLHGVAFVAARVIKVDAVVRDRAAADRAVEIVLDPDAPVPAAAAVAAPETATEAEKEREHIFTSIPERLASAVPPADDPDQPQYLAMYHALAANPTVGADALQPRAPREGESPQVALRREDLANAPGVNLAAASAPVPTQSSRPPTPAEAAAAEQRERAERAQAIKRARLPAGGREGSLPLPGEQEPPARPERTPQPSRDEAASSPTPRDLWGGTSAPSVLKQADRGEPGDRGIDYDQDATGPQTSGVARVGDFSLNTWEWNYAPWMQAFGNTLVRNWVVPEGRKLGLCWGHTVMRVVVERDGRVSQAEIIESEGHGSLHNASRAALLSSSPFAPLPAHFPLPHLEIRLTMSYPEPPR